MCKVSLSGRPVNQNEERAFYLQAFTFSVLGISCWPREHTCTRASQGALLYRMFLSSTMISWIKMNSLQKCTLLLLCLKRSSDRSDIVYLDKKCLPVLVIQISLRSQVREMISFRRRDQQENQRHFGKLALLLRSRRNGPQSFVYRKPDVEQVPWDLQTSGKDQMLLIHVLVIVPSGGKSGSGNCTEDT